MGSGKQFEGQGLLREAFTGAELDWLETQKAFVRGVAKMRDKESFDRVSVSARALLVERNKRWLRGEE